MQLSDAIPGFRIAKAASVSVLAIIDYVLRGTNLHTKEDLTARPEHHARIVKKI